MTAVGFEMNKPVLAIEDLTVSFDGFKAVDNLNLYVDRNECAWSSAPTAPARPRCWT
jgi:ABC-type uncharacterized transport system ATPase subunit